MKNLVFSNSTAAHKALKFHKTCKKDTKVLDSRPLSEGWKSSIEIAYLDSSIEETNNFIQNLKSFSFFEHFAPVYVVEETVCAVDLLADWEHLKNLNKINELFLSTHFPYMRAHLLLH